MKPGKRTILAIDDQVTSLTAIRTILESSFEVSLAKNVEIVETILKTTDVDLILLDLEMPGCSGLELLGSIRQNPAYYHIPVIVVSSHGQTDVIIEAKKAGANDFVVKPFNDKVLLDKIYTTFRIGAQKISRDILNRRLSILESLCQQGSSARVEKLIDELEHVQCDMVTDSVVTSICKCGKDLDYNMAIEKIHELLKEKSNTSP